MGSLTNRIAHPRLEAQLAQPSGAPGTSLWRKVGLAILLAILIAAPLRHVLVMERWTAGMSDLMAPWTGSRVALSGGDPYALSTTQQIQRHFYGHVLAPGSPQDKQGFAYPFYTVFLLAPLAWLPWKTAVFAFVACAIPAITLAVLAWLRVLGLSLTARMQWLCVVCVLVSWPFAVALRQQQLTLVAFLLATGACLLLAEGREALAGVLLGLTVLKPQLSLVLLFWLLLRAGLQRRFRLPAACLATIAILLAASFWCRPSWLTEWLAEMADYRRYTHARLMLAYYFGEAVGAMLLAVVALLSLAALWRLRHSAEGSPEFRLSIGLALALTVAVCPGTVASVYNQILLLPGCLLLIFPEHRFQGGIASKIARWALVCSYGLTPLAVLLESVMPPCNLFDNLPYANLLLPGLVASALALPVLAPAQATRLAAAALDRSQRPR
jgi:hypothetical protein